MCIEADFNKIETLKEAICFYKVVIRDGRDFKSLPSVRIAQGNNPRETGTRLSYKIGEKTESPILGAHKPGLYCFETLRRASVLRRHPCLIGEKAIILKVSCPAGTKKVKSESGALCVDQLIPVKVEHHV